MNNDMIDLMMALMDKFQWLTSSIASYLVKNDIDISQIPEMMS